MLLADFDDLLVSKQRGIRRSEWRVCLGDNSFGLQVFDQRVLRVICVKFKLEFAVI